MSPIWVCTSVDEAQLTRIAELIALKVRAGDLITLTGDLGAGKTTFARALIRALLDDLTAEVPSPTFALMQRYELPHLTLTHCDFYRLEPRDLDELGLDDAVSEGAVIVENHNLSAISDKAVSLSLSARKASLLARIGLVWIAVRHHYEEKVEPLFAEPMEVVTHFFPQLAALA